MPLIPFQKPDVANLASKLPRPLQYPVGAALGGLVSVFGADNPQSMMPGPATVEAPSALDLGKLPASLNYVTDLLRDVGYAPQAATEHLDEPVKSLVEALHQPLPEPDLSAAALGQRVTGLRPAANKYALAPEGFTYGGRRGLTMPRPGGLYKSARDIRGYYAKMGSAPEEDAAPAVRGLSDLQDFSMAPAAVSEAKPITGKTSKDILQTGKTYAARDTRSSEGRVPFSQVTPEHVKAVQQAAGSGMNQTQLIKQFPQFTKDTLKKIVQLPWKD